jgi:hypothetical protein
MQGTLILESLMAQPRKQRRDSRALGKSSGRVRAVEVSPEGAGDGVHNVEVGTRLAGRPQRGPHPLEAAIKVDERAVLFQEGGGWQHHIGQLCCLAQENLLHHDQIAGGQCGSYVLTVRVGLSYVLAHHIQHSNASVDGGVKHIGDPQAWICRRLDAPDRSHPAAYVRVGDPLIARKQIGQSSHIRGALDIVLAAQRQNSASFVVTDRAPQDGQIGQCANTIGAVCMLGDPKPVNDGRPEGRAIKLGREPQLLSRHAGDTRHSVRVVVVQRAAQLGEAGYAFGKECFVYITAGHKEVRDPVKDRNIRAWAV